jgi:hypothetical protein
MGTVFDDPNREAVGVEPIWVEEHGGNVDEPGGPVEPGEPLTLDEMTKAQLLEYAQERGISPANAAMSKDEIRASIDAAEAGT